MEGHPSPRKSEHAARGPLPHMVMRAAAVLFSALQGAHALNDGQGDDGAAEAPEGEPPNESTATMSEVIRKHLGELAQQMQAKLEEVAAGAGEESKGGEAGDSGRARSHCRFAPPLIHFIPDPRPYSMPLCL